MVASFVARPFSSIILVTDSDEELYCINTYRGSMNRTVEFNIRHGAFDQIVDHPWQLKGPKGTYEAKKVEEEEVVRRWDVSSYECLDMVSYGWSPDGKWIFSSVNDKSICIWELDGKELECWKGQRTLKISDWK
ncbi:hypothetical protein CRYUN_Cryun19dG0142200 [Craigia yunnanensis]